MRLLGPKNNRSWAGVVALIPALLLLVSCGSETATINPASLADQPRSASVGPSTHAFEAVDYTKVYYLDSDGGDDAGGATQTRPGKSLPRLIASLTSEAAKPVAICLAEGTYPVQDLQLPAGIDLFGGFEAGDWQRDVHRYRSWLQGDGRHRLLQVLGDAVLDGIYFGRGSVRGQGGAIRCDGTSPQISNCFFVGNQSLGPLEWAPKYLHETAHDGGAIYGSSGASPTLTGNVFAGNRTENGRGAAVAFAGRCQPVIRGNVFVDNVAGLDDPMRSSDGGAVSIFNWCNAEISANYFLSNKALARNDGGALFIALWSSAVVKDNLFVDSESGDDAGALFVGGQEHRYDAPLDSIPPKDQFYVTIANNQFYGNRNSSMNSGVMRFTMEARGEFVRNVTAHNGGVYFQRSEVDVRENLILDDMLYIETKEGLEIGTIEGNVIWGELQTDIPVAMKDNVLGAKSSEAICNRYLGSEGREWSLLATDFDRQIHQTRAILPEAQPDNKWVGRIVRAGDTWGIVQANKGNEIWIWGDFHQKTQMELLRQLVL